MDDEKGPSLYQAWHRTINLCLQTTAPCKICAKCRALMRLISALACHRDSCGLFARSALIRADSPSSRNDVAAEPRQSCSQVDPAGQYFGYKAAAAGTKDQEAFLSHRGKKSCLPSSLLTACLQGAERFGEDSQEENPIHGSGDHPAGRGLPFHNDFGFRVRGDIKQASWFAGHWMPPGSYGHGFQGIERTPKTACDGILGPYMLPLPQASDIEVGVVSKPMTRMYAAPVPSPIPFSDCYLQPAQVPERFLPAVGG